MSLSDAVDITHPLQCSILSWKVVDGHVEYEVEVERRIGSKEKWVVRRRYAEFCELDRCLGKFGIQLGLPPKKYFGNMNDEFVEKRKAALQKFLDSVCSHSLFFSGPAAVAFFGVLPESMIELHEWVLLSLRDKPLWSIHEHRTHCGWRAAKQICEVRNGRNAFVLSAVCFGPDRWGRVEELLQAAQFIRSLQYVHVNECVHSWVDSRGVIFVRPAFPDGTLRDHLYKSNWRDDFYTKYGVHNSVRSLETVDVRFIGRQVLEALSLLFALSIPFLDIHSGNILISDCGCEIIDVEQVLAGQPNFHRPSMLRMSAISSIEDMVVFAFGEFLFELLTGFFSFPLNSTEEGIAFAPPLFQPLLKSIFAPEGRSLPSLFDIINLDLFAEIPVSKLNRREIRMPAVAKEVFDGLSANIWARFVADRNQHNRLRKEQKLRQLMVSESEKLRRKQIVKCAQMKLSKVERPNISKNFITNASEAAATASK